MSKTRCDWLTAALSLTTGGPAPLLSGLAINLPGLRKDLRSPNNDWQQKENKFIKIHRRQRFRRATTTSFLRDGAVVFPASGWKHTTHNALWRKQDEGRRGMIGEFRRAEPAPCGAAGNYDTVLLNHNSGPALVTSKRPGHVAALVWADNDVTRGSVLPLRSVCAVQPGSRSGRGAAGGGSSGRAEGGSRGPAGSPSGAAPGYICRQGAEEQRHLEGGLITKYNTPSSSSC